MLERVVSFTFKVRRSKSPVFVTLVGTGGIKKVWDLG